MKIAIGLSGGVDSAAAAYLLKEQGHEVLGITLILQEGDGQQGDIEDAKKAAALLGIDFVTVDAREIFKKEVIGNFISEYQSGRTPSPCIICNEKLKFGLMLSQAMRMGCDKIATGHYAAVEYIGGMPYLRNTFGSKDQTYFLYRLGSDTLSKVIFPLSQYTKGEIREIAQKAGIPVFHKKDSLEICFVPGDDYVPFLLSKGVHSPEGDFVDTSGKVIGRHKGIINYTIGQRKGLGAFGKPMFVTKIDSVKNIVTLGENGEQYKSSLSCDNAVFNSLAEGNCFEAMVKIRYKAPLVKGVVTRTDFGFTVEFTQPQRSVTPGQSCALYTDSGFLIGGGVIK